MKNNSRKGIAEAKEYAFLLLKFRLRSEKEICERLKEKKFDAAVIKATVGFLKEKGLVNDIDFACQWAASRMKRYWGPERIRQELMVKGIAEEVVRAQLDAIQKQYPEERIIQEIARNKLESLRNVEPEAAKKRTWSYLVRRGFSARISTQVLDEL